MRSYKCYRQFLRVSWDEIKITPEESFFTYIFGRLGALTLYSAARLDIATEWFHLLHATTSWYFILTFQSYFQNKHYFVSNFDIKTFLSQTVPNIFSHISNAVHARNPRESSVKTKRDGRGCEVTVTWGLEREEEDAVFAQDAVLYKTAHCAWDVDVDVEPEPIQSGDTVSRLETAEWGDDNVLSKCWQSFTHNTHVLREEQRLAVQQTPPL